MRYEEVINIVLKRLSFSVLERQRQLKLFLGYTNLRNFLFIKSICNSSII